MKDGREGYARKPAMLAQSISPYRPTIMDVIFPFRHPTRTSPTTLYFLSHPQTGAAGWCAISSIHYWPIVLERRSTHQWWSSPIYLRSSIFSAGYGYITPQTPSGQLLCIFVSVTGIPITLLTLKSVGELITKLASAVVTKFEKKVLKRAEPKQVQSKSAVILVVLMLVLMIANSFLTKSLRGWTLIEGVYYWFVTFTTIGFGDYVLHQPQKIQQLPVNGSEKFVKEDVGTKEFIFAVVQKKLITLFSLMCLCFVASVLNSIMAAIEERKCRPRCPGCLPLKTRDVRDHPHNNGQHDIPKRHEPFITWLKMENTGLQRTNMDSWAMSEIN